MAYLVGQMPRRYKGIHCPVVELATGCQAHGLFGKNPSDRIQLKPLCARAQRVVIKPNLGIGGFRNLRIVLSYITLLREFVIIELT